MVVTSSGKEGNQDHGVGAGASTVFIFDMSGWVIVDNQVGILYYSLPRFFIRNHKREWMCIEVRLPPVHFYLLKGLAFFTSFFSLFHFQCLPALCYDRKARRERERRGVMEAEKHIWERLTKRIHFHMWTCSSQEVIIGPSVHGHLLSFFSLTQILLSLQKLWQLPLGIVLGIVSADSLT